MKRSILITSILISAGLLASCGGSGAQSITTVRQRNAELFQNTAIPQCVISTPIVCTGTRVTTAISLAKVSTKEANFSGSVMSHERFVGNDFTYANFTSTDLNGVYFVDSNLTNASFTNSRLSDVRFMSIKSPTKFSLANTDFSYAHLSSVWFGMADLQTTKFEGTYFDEVNLSGANLGSVDLSTAHFDKVRGVGVSGNPRLPQGWSIVNSTLVGPGADFSMAQIPTLEKYPQESVTAVSPAVSDAQLAAVNQTGGGRSSCPAPNISTSEPDFRGKSMKLVAASGQNWSGINISNADFSGMTLSHVDFTGTNLEGANFANANLDGIDFSFANINNANFTNAQLTNIRTYCTTALVVKLPTNWNYFGNDYIRREKLLGFSSAVRIRRGILVGPGADLRSLNLSGLNLAGVNLQQALLEHTYVMRAFSRSLTSATFKVNCDQQTTLPPKWTCRSGYLFGPGVDLSGASLKSIDIGIADLSGANIEGLVTQGLRGNLTLNPNTQLVNGVIVGPGVNLNGINLGVARVQDVDLAGATVDRANFSQVTFTNVHSNETLGNPILPMGWVAAGGLLLGPNADLQNSRYSSDMKYPQNALNNINLSTANLDHAEIFGFSGVPKAPKTWAVVPFSLNNLKRVNYLIGPNTQVPSELMAKWQSVTNPPAGYLRVGANLIGQKMAPTNFLRITADLTGMNLSGSDLSYFDLSSANLTSVRGENVTAKPISLTGRISYKFPLGWAVTAGYLVGPSANLDDAELLGADLSGVDLTNASMKRVVGRYLKFNSQTKLPAGWGIVKGVLVGPDANLDNVYLSDISLAGLDISNATFRDSVIKNVTGSEPVMSSSMRVIRGVLAAPEINLVCSTVRADEIPGTYADYGEINAALDPDLSSIHFTRTPC